MGAFYVMSAMGLFEMDGGSSVDPVYEISSPVFERITIQLDQNYYEGKEFVIEAKNFSAKNKYIQSAKLNEKELTNFWFRHEELAKGGKLELVMGPEPNKEWAVNSEYPLKEDVPVIVTTPYVSNSEKVFKTECSVNMVCDTKDAEIYYTLDGSEPTRNSSLFKGDVVVNKNTTVKMKAFKGNEASLTATAVFKKMGEIKKVSMNEVKPGLSYKYTHGIYRMVNDFLEVPPLKTGMVPIFTMEPREKEQFFSFDFEGYIDIKQAGEYTFYLATNDGGRMYVDDNMIINNDGLHPVVEVGKKVELQPGLHPISVKYFQEGGLNGLKVSYEGPGIEKQEIPSKVLFHKK